MADSMQSPNYMRMIPHVRHDDSEAISSDWIAVGKDIKKAMEKLANESEKDTQE